MTASGCETPADSGRLEADQILGIYDQWHDDLRRFLLATCGNAELADELLQATFSRLVEVGQTARPESIRGWLFKVAHNELRLWRRRSATHARWLDSGPPRPTAAAVPWEEAIRG